jgi:LCCL domain
MLSLKQVARWILISSAITSAVITLIVFNTSISDAQSIKKIEWTTTASNLSGRLDQDFTFNCPSGGQTNTIYGTDLYTGDSSICTAAAHAGLITVRDGGNVTIRIKSGFDFYNSTTRNEIKSNEYSSYGSSFIFIDRNGQPLLTKTPIKIIDWGTSASSLVGKLGQKFTFMCRRNGQASTIYGTDLYTADSSICTAAVHKGIISTKNGGKVTILIRGGSDSYQSSKRNGVKSNSYGSYGGSFVFVSAGGDGSVSNTPTESNTTDTASSSTCDDGEKTFLAAETNNFDIAICGKNKPTHYVGKSKQGGGSIKLPLSKASQDRYIAKNGNVNYIVTPKYLTIVQNGRTIQQDALTISK